MVAEGGGSHVVLMTAQAVAVSQMRAVLSSDASTVRSNRIFNGSTRNGPQVRGSLRVVTEWATRRRRAEKAEAQNLRQIPSARTIARRGTHESSDGQRL